jgi:hypothetical protein
MNATSRRPRVRHQPLTPPPSAAGQSPDPVLAPVRRPARLALRPRRQPSSLTVWQWLTLNALVGVLLLASGPQAAAAERAALEPEVAARVAANRAWYQALPQAPAPMLTKHGLVATELARWPVRGANQGVAVDAEHFYGIGNHVLVKHRKVDGVRVAEWISPRGGPLVHLNGGYVADGRLILAHSNFPQLPMASSLEIHDAATLAPVSTRSLGIRLGSLTWAEWRDGAWWACFANYNDQGTTPGFDQRWTFLGKFDERWQLLESWLFPPQIVAAWGKSSSSGGSWGDDGLLYVTGHDEQELYVVRLPKSGVTLEYVTTIDVPFEGQSWAWDRSAKGERIIYGISRARHEVIAARIPAVPEELRRKE